MRDRKQIREAIEGVTAETGGWDAPPTWIQIFDVLAALLVTAQEPIRGSLTREQYMRRYGSVPVGYVGPEESAQAGGEAAGEFSDGDGTVFTGAEAIEIARAGQAWQAQGGDYIDGARGKMNEIRARRKPAPTSDERPMLTEWRLLSGHVEGPEEGRSRFVLGGDQRVWTTLQADDRWHWIVRDADGCVLASGYQPSRPLAERAADVAAVNWYRLPAPAPGPGDAAPACDCATKGIACIHRRAMRAAVARDAAPAPDALRERAIRAMAKAGGVPESVVRAAAAEEGIVKREVDAVERALRDEREAGAVFMRGAVADAEEIAILAARLPACEERDQIIRRARSIADDRAPREAGEKRGGADVLGAVQLEALVNADVHDDCDDTPIATTLGAVREMLAARRRDVPPSVLRVFETHTMPRDGIRYATAGDVPLLADAPGRVTVAVLAPGSALAGAVEVVAEIKEQLDEWNRQDAILPSASLMKGRLHSILASKGQV